MKIGYLYIAPFHVWRDWRTFRATVKFNNAVYIFRNLPHVIKWIPGRILPRRWGIGFFGLIEFGDRGS